MIPVFKPVPLQVVLQASAKVEMKAIYRRLRRTVGAFDEEILEIGEDGLPLWDLTTPLPVARHNDWIKKGFEYVTLADRESLDKVAPFLAVQEPPLNARDYLQHPHFGAWNPKLYSATAAEGDRQAVRDLFKLLDEFGQATVEQIRGTKIPVSVIAAWQRQKTGSGKAVAAQAAGEPSAPSQTAPKPKPKPRAKNVKPAAEVKA
jgi:hypothetical protein